MRRPDSRYIVLWLFLFGIVIVLFLQVISGYNINRLIGGNKSLRNELQIQNDLRTVEVDLFLIESNVRGAVISGNKKYIRETKEANSHIEQQLQQMIQNLRPRISQSELSQLQDLLQKKIDFNKQVIDTFYKRGKITSQNLIGTNRGTVIRDSIIHIITHIETNRQKQLRDIIDSIELTGKRARIWGFFITAMALGSLIVAFLFIINQGRNQQRMIKALNESEKRSKELANMQEQFLANMSHEIRTPMNSILGFTNLLKRTELNPMQREYIQNIHSAGENLLALVNDILDLSKIEAGKMHIEETRFSLRSMVSSVGAMFIEKIRERDLKFNVHIGKDVPDILSGDAVRLTQILVNLISNAVKFTDEGEITVYVQLLASSETDVRIRLCVKDTGIGIAPEKRSAIFERFQQAELETTRRFGGTGLGLSIVKQLIEIQGGTIRVESELGKGSEFIVELNYKLPDLAQMYSEALAEQEEQVPLQKIKVLVAEDNHMNQQLIKHLMKSWSLDYSIVHTGAEAVEELKGNSYSIVLMDIQMPEMDGYTATTIIRNELKLDVPIIAMTAHAMVGEKEKCLQLGMNDYVSKPIKETVLYNIIARHAQHIPEKTEPAHHIHLSYLHQLSGNDKDFEKEILNQFLTQAPVELSQLEDSVKQNNFDAVRRTAHSLKSTVGYVGLADELHPYLEEIEKDAIIQNDARFEKNLEHIKNKCTHAIIEVKSLLDNGFV
ncbi:MAG TPA: ATP-binding protein [Flavisolibacter sp.]|jgi:signal transduction histidine kinase/CheY-like chemotaxis protein/HPt (histidine-containing phosphotransfer) domain-containing protein|nr:ATP-binding protein [Flavisolibacter sp.]